MLILRLFSRMWGKLFISYGDIKFEGYICEKYLTSEIYWEKLIKASAFQDGISGSTGNDYIFNLYGK